MRFLVFDLKGKFAHFRKFYTNTSSLSYLVPPRTVIEGIIAAILGYERDTYYEDLSSENLSIAVQKLEKTYKIVQTVNYIKADSPKKIKNPEEHTQVPLELLASYSGKVAYRVYCTHKDNKIYSQLLKKLEQNKPEYPIYFGSAPFLAKVEFVGEFEGVSFSKSEAKIITVLNTEFIKSMKIFFESTSTFAIIKDRMPCDFDKDRFATRINTFIHDENLNPIKIELSSAAKDKVFLIKGFDAAKEELCISFM